MKYLENSIEEDMDEEELVQMHVHYDNENAIHWEDIFENISSNFDEEFSSDDLEEEDGSPSVEWNKG
jgi:hypothetical protein